MRKQVKFSSYGELLEGVHPTDVIYQVGTEIALYLDKLDLPVVDPVYLAGQVVKALFDIQDEIKRFRDRSGRKITVKLWGKITRALPLISSIDKEKGGQLYSLLCQEVRRFYEPEKEFEAELRDARDVNLMDCSDSNSCFKSGKERSYTPIFFSENGIMLLKINSSRCWLWELNDKIVLFNFYGIDPINNRYDVQIISEAVRRLYEQPRCKYVFTKMASDKLYINGESCLVVYFNRDTIIPETIHIDDYEFKCKCGQIAPLHEFEILNSSYYFKMKYEDTTIEGRSVLVCPDCYEDRYDLDWLYYEDEEEEEYPYYCVECGEGLYDRNVEFAFGEPYCSYHFEELFFYCECHEDYTYREDMLQTAYGSLICKDCYEEYFNTCEGCSEIFPKDDLIYTDENVPYCEKCFNAINKDNE